MTSKSIYGADSSEIKIALENSLKDGFSPTVAVVFISVTQDREAIRQLFKDHNIEILGATSCGEFTNESETKGEAAILLMDMPKDYYKIIFEPIGNGTIKTAVAQLSDKALKTFSNPSLIVCSTGLNDKGAFFDGDQFVSQLEENLGSEKWFFGGMAGDDWILKRTYIFTQNEETNNGIEALVLNANKIQLKGMAITGWKPMGIARKVTKSNGNLLLEIDGKPAMDMYLKYLGRPDLLNKEEYDILRELSFEYPFIVERDNNETILKSPMKIDLKQHALFMDLEMPVGTKFWFTKPPELDIVEEVLEKANLLKNAPDEQADAMLIFSCAGREPVLGPFVTEENEGLAKLWKTPMAGFFTYGEIGRSYQGKQNFHSGACCWVTLNEK